MWDNGIVIGKFYPPHAGHQYLIDAAQERVKHLIILVCRRAGQKPDADQRAQWLQEMQHQATVLTIEDIGDDDNSERWAAYTRQFLGFTPQVVCSSEDYGLVYAKFMGSEHVLVDKERRHVPCSGRAIRANPFAHWKYLSPPVRAYYALRIALVGAESSGTTTLARDLATEYQTAWVPEYGRAYSEGRMFGEDTQTWRTEEFVHIARMQNEMEDELARHANKFLFCDTNAFATAIWHERYLGFWSEQVERLSVGRRYGLYLVTDGSIPFVQDGLRDGEFIRPWMQKRFLAELDARSLPYMVVTGDCPTRMQTAKDAIEAVIRTMCSDSNACGLAASAVGFAPASDGQN